MREFSKGAGSQISAAQSTRDTVHKIDGMQADQRRDEVKFLGRDVKDYHVTGAILRGVAMLPEAKRSALVRLLLDNLEHHAREQDTKELAGERLAAAIADVLRPAERASDARPKVVGEGGVGRLNKPPNRLADDGKPKPDVRSHGK